MFSSINFDHSQSSTAKAIGLSKEEIEATIATIIYETITYQLRLQELYDNPAEVPIGAGLNKSKIIEACLKRITNQRVGLYMLIILSGLYEDIVRSMEALANIEKITPTTGIKFVTLPELLYLSQDPKKLKEVKEMGEFIQKSGYNYEEFLNFFKKKQNLESSKDYSDINKMIDNAFEGFDENDPELV